MRDDNGSRPILLDTIALLYSLSAPERLGKNLAQRIAAGASLLVSAVSLWEVVVKHAKGQIDLAGDPERVLLPHIEDALKADALPLLPRHVFESARLPWIHKDPFDRLLIGQAVSEGVLFATNDEMVSQYPTVSVIW